MEWFAQYHYIFVHFPITLVIMAGVAELIMVFRKKESLDSTVKFLLIGALVFIIPTVLSGLFLKESDVNGVAGAVTLWLHQLFAYISLILLFVTITLRYRFRSHFLYFSSLFLLVVSILLTAHFGGTLAFGPFSYLPFTEAAGA